jgi:LAO/AO transport system ATPase
LAHKAEAVSAELIAALLAGERRAIARAVSAVENETAAGAELLRALHPHLGAARVLGITGPPGAGKSTLVDALIGELLSRGGRVGVVAIDPSSPISGGAILGDRIRMATHQGDERVFIRSLAARGHAGGLARSAARAVDVLDAAGYAHIIVETVGAGQSEVEVADLAHTCIVVLPPGLGDDVQAIKAGILEIADIYVVNKADLPLAARAERELLAMIALRSYPAWKPPVLRTVATTGEGVAKLAEAIAAHAQADTGRRAGGDARPARTRRRLAASAAERLRRAIEQGGADELDALCEQLARGELDHAAADLQAIEIAVLRMKKS